MDLNSLRGFDLNLPAIIDLFGTEKVIRAIGQKKVIDAIGLGEVIETAGREKVLEKILPNLSKEEIEKLIEQNGSGEKATESD